MGRWDLWSEAEVGKPMWFLGEGLVAGTRIIETSPVVTIEEADD